jgi:hypothetical protein
MSTSKNCLNQHYTPKMVRLKPPNVCLWYIELIFGSILALGRRIYEELYLDSFRLATSKRDLQACPVIEMGPPQVAWTLSSVSHPLFKFDQLLFFNTKIVHLKSPNVWFWYIELGLCSLLVLGLCIICEKPIDSFKLEASKQHMSIGVFVRPTSVPGDWDGSSTIRVKVFIPVMPFSNTWPKTNMMLHGICAFEASKCVIVVNGIAFFRLSVGCGYAYLMWSTCRLIQVGNFQARPSSISARPSSNSGDWDGPTTILVTQFHHVPLPGVDVTPAIWLPNTTKNIAYNQRYGPKSYV